MSALLEDKFMRVLLMFDVPTKTKKEQKYAAKFRNELIKLGFFMMQFSVYMRICKGIVSAKAVVSRVRGILPPVGNVRSLIITEKQFDNMQILLGSAGFNESVNDDKNLVLFEFDEKIGDFRYFSEDLKGEDSGVNAAEFTQNSSKNKVNFKDENLSENFDKANENLFEFNENSSKANKNSNEFSKNSAKNEVSLNKKAEFLKDFNKKAKKPDEPSLFEF